MEYEVRTQSAAIDYEMHETYDASSYSKINEMSEKTLTKTNLISYGKYGWLRNAWNQMYINQLSTEWLDSDFESSHPEGRTARVRPNCKQAQYGSHESYIITFCY